MFFRYLRVQNLIFRSEQTDYRNDIKIPQRQSIHNKSMVVVCPPLEHEQRWYRQNHMRA